MSSQIGGLGGLVLCGGRSRRMGLEKALLPFGRECLLQRVVRLLLQVAEPVTVVAALGQTLPELPTDVLIARDRHEGQGPLEGILAGLLSQPSSIAACYVSACDVPLLVPDFVRSLRERLQDFDVVVPAEGAFHHPLAGIYRTSLVSRIERLLEAGQRRPLDLFDRVPTLRVPVDELRGVDPQLETLQNLNSPDDYFRAAARAGVPVPDEIRAVLEEGGKRRLLG